MTTATLSDTIPVAAMHGPSYQTLGMLRSVQRAVDRDGPVLRLDFGGDGAHSLLLGTPAHVADWRLNTRHLAKEVDAYPAPASLARMILDNNLTTAREGAEWEAMRARVSPLMRYKMPAYPYAVRRATAAMMTALRTGGANADLLTLCGLWSARTVSIPVMGLAFDGQAVLDMVDALRGCMFSLVEQSATLPQTLLRRDARLVALRADLDRMVATAVAQADPDDGTMVATLMSQKGMAFGATPDRDAIDDLRPVLIGALAAAVHNNSLAMFWTLSLLARHPATCDAIAAEARATADRPDWTIAVAPAALAAVREALRIYPVLPFIERRATQPVTLAGTPVDAGQTVIFSPWVIHRDARVWDDPLAYRPDRMSGRPDLTRWLPFGMGHRSCIGSNLALSQISHGCGLICRDLILQKADGQRPTVWQPGYRVLLEPRAPGARLTATPRSDLQH